MIDLSRKAGQILNYLSVNTIDNVDIISNVPFNHEHASLHYNRMIEVILRCCLKWMII